MVPATSTVACQPEIISLRDQVLQLRLFRLHVVVNVQNLLSPIGVARVNIRTLTRRTVWGVGWEAR